MKHMKKLIAVAVLMSMLFVLCACGGGDVLKGTWTRTSEMTGEVIVKFDGKGGCEATWTLIDEPTTSKGTYTIESENTGTVKLAAWEEAQTFTFEVSETGLKITNNYSIFGGEFTKK